MSDPNVFNAIVLKKISTINRHDLNNDDTFCEYMNHIWVLSHTISEDLISLAIVNYIYFHKDKKEG